MSKLKAILRTILSSRLHLLTLALVLALGAVPVAQLFSAPSGIAQAAPDVRTVQLPFAFVPNQGQADSAIRYQAQGRGGTLGFAAGRVDLTLPASEGVDTTVGLQLHFVDAQADAVIEADQPLPAQISYYRGAQPQGWYASLPTFGRITYRGLYPGIDLGYEGVDGQLKGTFIVTPGANPAQIRWRYEGADRIQVDDATGDLQILLGAELVAAERAPLAWQDSPAGRTYVAAAYTIQDGQVGFALGKYDRGLPLTIDPTIVYETVFNGAFLDSGRDVAVDAAGNAYIVAYAYQDNNFLYVVKLSPQGDLLWTTYLQGSGVDHGDGIVVNGAGDVYVVGRTLSADFPVLNALQPQKNGPSDAFLTKLSGQDGTLLFSTYFGGSRAEWGRDIALDSAGNVYLTGSTDSTDFPTVNPIQDALNLTYCFCDDAFVSRISADGQHLLYSTYLGGGFDDAGESIAVDSSDQVYVAGNTNSEDWPLQAPLQATYRGSGDGFVTKLSADGQSLLYSTFLGGEDWDRVQRIAVNAAGQIYVGGTTRSAAFPTTPGAFQETFAGEILGCGQPPYDPLRNCDDIFVTSLVADGSAYAYSTYLGGIRDEEGRGVAINSAGEVYVVGYTYSADFPGGGPDPAGDIILSKLNGAGSELLYTLTIDSSSPNAGHGVAVDGAGSIYLTAGINVPSDLYAAKITEGIQLPPPPPTPVVQGAPGFPSGGEDGGAIDQ